MARAASTSAPHSNDTTSKDAAQSIGPHLSALEGLVLAWVTEYNSGVTADYIVQKSGMRTSTVTARIRALVLRGLVKDSGSRGTTRSGRSAIVWVKGDGVPSLRASRSHFDRGVLSERYRIVGLLEAFAVGMEMNGEDAWKQLMSSVNPSEE